MKGTTPTDETIGGGTVVVSCSPRASRFCCYVKINSSADHCKYSSCMRPITADLPSQKGDFGAPLRFQTAHNRGCSYFLLYPLTVAHSSPSSLARSPTTRFRDVQSPVVSIYTSPLASTLLKTLFRDLQTPIVFSTLVSYIPRTLPSLKA